MKVLVTGADGFVGEHLVRALKQRGHGVLGGIQGAEPHARILTEPELEALAWIQFDLRDARSIADLVEEARPDALIHLAGISSVRESWQSPADVVVVNVLGALHLLLALRGLPRGEEERPVLLVGSSEVYGRPGSTGDPLAEDAPLRPYNPYGASKAAQEMLGWALGRVEGLRLIQTRSFSHTGPGQQPPFVLADWALQLLRIRAGLQPPEIRVGDLEVTRDITDVRDVADAYVRLIEADEARGAFNVCSGREYTLRQLLGLLQEIVQTRARVVEDTTRLRPAEVRSLVGSAERLRRLTGWVPTREIGETLGDLVTSLAGGDLRLPAPT